MASRLRSIPLLDLQRSGGFSLLEVIVAIAILGIAIVSLIQLFSGSLRTTRKTDEYSRGLIHARGMMEEAYAVRELEEFSGEYELEDGYTGEVTVESLPLEEDEKEAGVTVYLITVTVRWPPSGMTSLSGIRMIHEKPEETNVLQ